MVPMIKQFDTHGEPIRIHGVKHTVKNYARCATLRHTHCIFSVVVKVPD